MSKTYIIGHKSPDLDSVAAAVSYAVYKNKTENTDKYLPAIAEDINLETAYLLENLNMEKPEVLSDASGQNLLLVDHNEDSQAVTGFEKANIVEVLDHHKVVFSGDLPIEFCVKPWGSSCTIIADKFLGKGVDIDPGLAKLMLGAILVDTVITKSPTCTSKDVEIINKLSEIAGVENWEEFGMEIFKVRSNVSELSDIEIIKSDYKDFNFKAGKFGIGQVETVSLDDFKNRDESIIAELTKLKDSENYHTVLLFITNILDEGSHFLIVSDEIEKVAEAFETKFENNKAYIKGVISRKKQVAPKFVAAFDK